VVHEPPSCARVQVKEDTGRDRPCGRGVSRADHACKGSSSMMRHTTIFIPRSNSWPWNWNVRPSPAPSSTIPGMCCGACSRDGKPSRIKRRTTMTADIHSLNVQRLAREIATLSAEVASLRREVKAVRSAATADGARRRASACPPSIVAGLLQSSGSRTRTRAATSAIAESACGRHGARTSWPGTRRSARARRARGLTRINPLRGYVPGNVGWQEWGTAARKRRGRSGMGCVAWCVVNSRMK
jgi:hypothetical protein